MVGQVILLLLSLFANSYASLRCGGDATLLTESKPMTRDSMNFEKLVIKQQPEQKLTFTSSSDIDLEKVEWFHNNKKITVKSENSHPIYYVWKNKTIELVFSKPRPDHTGQYKMQSLNEKGEIIEFAECDLRTDVPLLPNKLDTIRVVRGDNYNITVTSVYSPLPQGVTWEFYSPKTEKSTEARFQKASSDGIQHAILLTTDLTDDDEGFFIATTVSKTRKDRTVFAVRVKDPKAVYWPLIGIVIEVVILLITILIYEKRLRDKRQKQSAQEANDLKTAIASQGSAAANADKDNTASIRV